MKRTDIEAVIEAAAGMPVWVQTSIGVEGTLVRLETRREDYGPKWRYMTYVVVQGDGVVEDVSVFACEDCGTDTAEIGEYFMVRGKVWRAGGGGRGMLCIGCLEDRLGRRLELIDFTSAPTNWCSDWRSPRLQARLMEDKMTHMVRAIARWLLRRLDDAEKKEELAALGIVSSAAVATAGTLDVSAPYIEDEAELARLRAVNNPKGLPTGHYTGRCMRCGSRDIWDDATAYGCNCCGGMYMVGHLPPMIVPNRT